MSLPPDYGGQDAGAAAGGGAADISPEYIFSKIQNFSNLLRDISLNVPAQSASPTCLPDQSANSSLGLLPAEAMSDMDTASNTLDTLDICPPSNISLGRYLQPACISQSLQLSDSDEENMPPTENLLFNQQQPPLHQFLAPFPVLATSNNTNINSSTPLPANRKPASELLRAVIDQGAALSNSCVADFEASVVFPWDKIVQGETAADIASMQKYLSPDLSTLGDSWQPQDPSFCSGKFSARSTSFGGENNTWDENFSDFATVPTFQVSLGSEYTRNSADGSIFQGGYSAQQCGEVFPGFDVDAQAQLGMEFGDQEFGSLGKDQLKCFLDKEEEECLQANPFIEDDQCEEPSNSSVFSGVSDKSIMLRNSNLLGGDTSQVNLEQLKMETQLLTKVSRCEYFRHNSSRLGSLEESVADSDRPGLGFVHSIRSPERRPCALLSDSMACTGDSQPSSLSSTFSKTGEKAKASDECSSSSDSAASSANNSFMQSGNSTQTVVSMMDQSGTLQAAELASRLQTLADQLAGGQAQAVSYPDVVEDSIFSNHSTVSQLEASIRESIGPGNDINLSTISKVLAEASISSDPQHFVSILLGCLKKRDLGTDIGGEDVNNEQGGETVVKYPSVSLLHQKLSSNTSRAANNSNVFTPSINKSCITSMTSSASLSFTPTLSKAALAKARSGVSSATKPIKPFSKVSSVPPNQVAPVKPQPSTQLDPSSVTTSAQTPPTTMAASLPNPASQGGNHQRKLSGARHSSPIKKSELTASTPIVEDLSRLLDSTETPSFHLAPSSHLTTSTPFQNGLNLSTVILDHVTHNQSASPVNYPSINIPTANMNFCTLNPAPALSTSLLRPALDSPSQEVHLPPHAVIELSPDWTHSSVVSSHAKVTVPVPVMHNLTKSSSMVVKVTSMWVGTCLVPPQHWEQLGDIQCERIVNLEHDKSDFGLELNLKKAGTFSFNIAVMLENGFSSTGLLRLQVEEPNIQVLTENGSRVEFGSLAEDCSTSLPLVLVNCGAAAVQIQLEIRKPHDLFIFSGGAKIASFTIPGVEGEQVDGQGVAKEVEVHVDTAGISVTQPKVFKTEMLVMLGENNIMLGTLDIMVRVGTARLRSKKNMEPVQFNCLPGESVTQSIQLGNSGNIPLMLQTMVEDLSIGTFTCDKNIKISPENDLSLSITFSCSPLSSLTSTQHSLYLSVSPNGPKHVISLQVNILPTAESVLHFQSSRPILSFGTIKKAASSQQKNKEVIPSVFPVESDRSIINFFSVPVGSSEVQLITLRNSTTETVSLNMIIRETDNFFMTGPAGLVSTSQLVLPSQATYDVKVIYKPTMVGTNRGKLVLKPQGKVSGKSIKASITLCGVAGSCNIVMEGLEEVEHNRYELSCQPVPVKMMVRFINHGDATGFVKIVCGDGKQSPVLDISPSVFLLESGFAKDVLITTQEEELSVNPLLTIFTGPELVRQVLKRARKLPGAAAVSDNPVLMGVSLLEDFPGENFFKLKENYSGHLSLLDGKQFYQKTRKQVLSLSVPGGPVNFDQLMAEETLSETRIDQSIAVPIPTTMQKISHQEPRQADKQSFSHHKQTSFPATNLVLIPSKLSLTSGGEAIVKVMNKSPSSVHWDLSWPVSQLSITPHAGLLAPHGQAVVCIQAATGQAAWQGQVSVYSDNSIATMEVVVAAAKISTCIAVSNNLVDVGKAVLGSTTTGSIMLTNPCPLLVQWKAQVSPSFFSLPQCSGLLNPSQTISLPILFKPAATGTHSASLSISATIVKGGQEMTQSTMPVMVTLTGTTMPFTEVDNLLSTKQNLKKSVGTVSLESEVVMFPDTSVGETTVSKVKIKNRSGSDQALQILSLLSPSPFRTLHSALEVKNQCFCTVPVQFRPLDKGEYKDTITFMWEGNKITATLFGKAT